MRFSVASLFSVQPVVSAGSRFPHVPEYRQGSLQDPAAPAPPARRLEVAAEGGVDPFSQRFRLELTRQPPTPGLIVAVDPGAAQFLHALVLWPANPRCCTGADAQGDKRIKVVRTGRVLWEEGPAALIQRSLAV